MRRAGRVAMWALAVVVAIVAIPAVVIGGLILASVVVVETVIEWTGRR